MKLSTLAIALICCIHYSCSNSNSTANSESVVSADSSALNSAPTTNDAVLQLSNTDSIGNLSSPSSPAAVSAPTAQPVGQTAPGMNPPHGEPGHRCEIAVGAPLNSSPAAKPADGSNLTTPVLSPATSNPVSTPGAATANPVATPTAAGMNSPHGQPGHDCAIPVGAPLKK